MSLNKKSLKDVENFINDEIVRLLSHVRYMQWYIATLDNIKSKQYKSKLIKVIRKPSDNIYHVQFCNKEIELMNLPSIFNNTFNFYLQYTRFLSCISIQAKQGS